VAGDAQRGKRSRWVPALVALVIVGAYFALRDTGGTSNGGSGAQSNTTATPGKPSLIPCGRTRADVELCGRSSVFDYPQGIPAKGTWTVRVRVVNHTSHPIRVESVAAKQSPTVFAQLGVPRRHLKVRETRIPPGQGARITATMRWRHRAHPPNEVDVAVMTNDGRLWLTKNVPLTSHAHRVAPVIPKMPEQRIPPDHH
jgi:hypothetical protein